MEQTASTAPVQRAVPAPRGFRVVGSALAYLGSAILGLLIIFVSFPWYLCHLASNWSAEQSGDTGAFFPGFFAVVGFPFRLLALLFMIPAWPVWTWFWKHTEAFRAVRLGPRGVGRTITTILLPWTILLKPSFGDFMNQIRIDLRSGRPDSSGQGRTAHLIR